jgi:hypothetical protein
LYTIDVHFLNFLTPTRTKNSNNVKTCTPRFLPAVKTALAIAPIGEPWTKIVKQLSNKKDKILNPSPEMPGLSKSLTSNEKADISPGYGR